jgi:Dolichyl-phosphate-mannose-protein mannosyltransferase
MPENKHQSGISSSSTSRYVFIAIVAVGIALRLFFAINASPDLVDDENSYTELANEMLMGRGYSTLDGHPTAGRPPLYPMLLTAMLWVFKGAYMPIRLLQIALNLLTIYWIYHLAQRWKPDKPHYAIWAAGLLLLNLSQIHYASRLFSETLFTTLLVGGLFYWDRSCKTQSARSRDAAYSGVLLGLASLTRAVGLGIPFLLAAYALTRRRNRMQCAILLTAAIAVIMPWTVRNALVMGHFVPVSTKMGFAMWQGMNPDSRGFGYSNYDEIKKVHGPDVVDEVVKSRMLTNDALQSIAADPLRFMRLGVQKVLWFFYPFDGLRFSLPSPFDPTYGMLFSLLLLAWVLPRVFHPPPGWVLVVFAYFLFTAVIFYGSPRFRLPLEPLLALWAAGVGAAMTSRLRGKWLSMMLILVLLNIMAYAGGSKLHNSLSTFAKKHLEEPGEINTPGIDE